MAARDLVEQLRSRPAAFAWAVARRVYRVLVERFARNKSSPTPRSSS